MTKFLVGGLLQHVNALNISKPLGEISTLRYLAEKSYDKKIVEDLSESFVTTEFTSSDFRPHFEAFSRMIPYQPGNCPILLVMCSRIVAFPFLAIIFVAVNQRHECPVASNCVLRRALSNVN